MAKAQLTLYIDTDLKKIAKNRGFNLSREFEEWLRVRCNMNVEAEKIEDPDKIIAEYRLKIEKMQSIKELKHQQKNIDIEKNAVLDFQIDNMRDNEEDLNDISEARIRGIQFVFKKKFNKMLNPIEAKELMDKRIAEREDI